MVFQKIATILVGESSSVYDERQAMNATDNDKTPEYLTDTRAVFDRFVADRTEDGYKEVLSTFVFEVMSTRRSAHFPTSIAIVQKFLSGEGPFASVIVRDANGLPYQVFLTDPSCEINGSEASVDIIAANVFNNVIKDPALAGVAINPWNGGGVCLPKNLLINEIQEIHQQIQENKGENMTINMSAFEELRKRILSAGQEELVSIKHEIAEYLKQCKYIAVNGEDARGEWYLYLDALCDIRLGACNWNRQFPDVRLMCDGCDHDMLLDWYEALATVTRSINQRQNDKRGGCSESKLAKLKDFYFGNRGNVERLIGEGVKYAAYLEERTQQVFRMAESGMWSVLPKLDNMRWEYL